jgi:uncharacterized protein (TIGR04552 family)
MNFSTAADARELLQVCECDLADDADKMFADRVKNEAIDYLRKQFAFPIPKKIESLPVDELMLLASSQGHKQLCACTILKCMHIIQHLQGQELLYVLPLSDQEIFHLVEEKVFRVIGGMMAAGMPVIEFLGGRKNKYSLYTKLLAKERNVATQIYDKLRFRIVTRTKDDILPVLLHFLKYLFPFNYVIPGESTNTMFRLPEDIQDPHFVSLAADPRANVNINNDDITRSENSFSDRRFRIVHFVTEIPLRVPRSVLERSTLSTALGRVIFALVEFQVVDRETDVANELGDASHDRYKERQRQAVMRRLKLGSMQRPAVTTQTEAASIEREQPIDGPRFELMLPAAPPRGSRGLEPSTTRRSPSKKPPRPTSTKMSSGPPKSSDRRPRSGN